MIMLGLSHRAPPYTSGYSRHIRASPRQVKRALLRVSKLERRVVRGNSSQSVAYNIQDGAVALPKETVKSPGLPSSKPASISETLSKALSISEEHATWLITNRPALLQLPPSVLRLKFKALAELLCCSLPSTAALVVKYPQILDTQIQTLSAQLQAVGLTLQLPIADIAGTVCKAPELLLHRPSHIRARIMSHARVLNLPLDRAAALALREPRLFSLTHEQLQLKLRFLEQVLVQEPAAILTLVKGHPALLSMSEERSREKLANLQSSLVLSDPDLQALVCSSPILLSYSAERIQHHVATLSAVISLPQLQHMVMQEPTLITRPAAIILERLQALRELLSCGRAEALSLVARRPSLLTRNTQTLKQSLRAMSIWKMAVVPKLELVRRHPVLLRLSPSEVHFRCRWLRQLVMGNGYFHNTLRSLPPVLLGSIILHLPHVWSRLAYLAESKQESTVRIMAAVQGATEDFQTRFPDYQKWLDWQLQDMEEPVPWRCAQFILDHSNDDIPDPRYVIAPKPLPAKKQPSTRAPDLSSSPPTLKQPMLSWPFQQRPSLRRNAGNAPQDTGRAGRDGWQEVSSAPSEIQQQQSSDSKNSNSSSSSSGSDSNSSSSNNSSGESQNGHKHVVMPAPHLPRPVRPGRGQPLPADSSQGSGRSEPEQHSKVPSNSAVFPQKNASQPVVLEPPPQLPKQQQQKTRPQKKQAKHLQKPPQVPTLPEEQQQRPTSSSPHLQQDLFPKRALQPITQKRRPSKGWSKGSSKHKAVPFDSSNGELAGIQLPDPVQPASRLLSPDLVHSPAPQPRPSADYTPSHSRRDALPRTENHVFPESETVVNGFHARQAFGLDTYLCSSGSPALPRFVSC